MSVMPLQNSTFFKNGDRFNPNPFTLAPLTDDGIEKATRPESTKAYAPTDFKLSFAIKVDNVAFPQNAKSCIDDISFKFNFLIASLLKNALADIESCSLPATTSPS